MHQWNGLHEYFFMETQKCEFFFKKFEIDEIEFCPYPEFPYAEKRNRPAFVNISHTQVIDTSTERSSRVLQHGNQKFDFVFQNKKFEIEFDLCWRAEINIQVGLTYMSTSGMHRRLFEGRHLVSFKGISKKGPFFLLYYVFFAVQSQSEIRLFRSNL